jgi:hypothetical protein
LTASFQLDRFIYVPNLASWVDCADPLESCVMGAAASADVAGTAVWTATSFDLPPSPPSVRGTIALAPAGTVPRPGSVVTVEGFGFRADAVVNLHQCLAGVAQPADCNQRVATVVADGTGAFSADITVVGDVAPPGGTTTDCFAVEGTCAIAAAEAVDFPGTVTSVTLPVTVPDAPTIGTATGGYGQATVSWTAPLYGGGAALTGYVVTPYVGAVAQTPVPFASTATTQVVTGLVNGTTYTFTVAATNSVGTGAESEPSNPVTPATMPPGAPTIGSATAGDGQATVSWTAPASDGGSPIVGYVVTPYVGYLSQGPRYFLSTATTQVITRLSNGTTYTFRVRALNVLEAGYGVSAFSAYSNAVTPSGPTAPLAAHLGVDGP